MTFQLFKLFIISPGNTSVLGTPIVCSRYSNIVVIDRDHYIRTMWPVWDNLAQGGQMSDLPWKVKKCQ